MRTACPCGCSLSAFLLVLGLAVAATAQITGVLLVFALLVAPAATAQLITPRIAPSLLLSVAIGVLVTWLGLALAYFTNTPRASSSRRSRSPHTCSCARAGAARDPRARRATARRRGGA